MNKFAEGDLDSTLQEGQARLEGYTLHGLF